MRRLASIAFALALPALAALAPGCGGGGPTSLLSQGGKDYGAIRFINASPNAPGLDAYLRGNEYAHDIVYAQASEYVPVKTGQPYAEFKVTGTDQTVAEAGIGIAKKGNFTLIAVNPASEMGTLFVSDDYEAPAKGNARLRLLHVAPGAGTVDVYITAPGASIAGIEPTVADLAYLGSSGYLEAPAATYQLRICPAGTKTVAIDSGPVALAAGQVLSGLALGDPQRGVPFSALVLQDRI